MTRCRRSSKLQVGPGRIHARYIGRKYPPVSMQSTDAHAQFSLNVFREQGFEFRRRR